MGYGIDSLGNVSHVYKALRGGEHEMIMVCRPFEGMSLVTTLDFAKALAPSSHVVVLGDDMSDTDLRDALISGSFTALNRLLDFHGLSSLLSNADSGLLVFVRE